MEYESVSLKELAAEPALFSFVFLHCTTLCKRSVVPASKMCHLRKCCRYPARTGAENRSVTVNIVLRLRLCAVISPPRRVYRKTPLVYHQSVMKNYFKSCAGHLCATFLYLAYFSSSHWFISHFPGYRQISQEAYSCNQLLLTWWMHHVGSMKSVQMTPPTPPPYR